MSIRALFIDMDGTLLTSSNEVSKRNAEAITRLINQGTKVFLATGRHYEITVPYHSLLGLKTPMICLNGASIYEGFTGRIAQMNPVTLDEANFHRVTNENACDVIVHTADGLYCNRVRKEIDVWTKESRIPPKYIGDLRNADYRNVLKYNVRTGRHGSHLSHLFRDEADVIDWQDGFEIMAPGISKWAGIQVLIRAFGINPEETAAIGDGPNDIQMLRNAGISAAMANAGPEVKMAADVVTGHHEQDGLAEFIERYLVRSYAI
ncbi:HAD family hydrolase [Lentibacillus sp. CBA3610]|uniref:HAD family hydrolase n=1 Tax=Lentibacillus sp. CBA3610 TaxID=2518176 RepID=UPI00159597C6|nr:HAD family hydrolase [Lentibacillus sp. CBA3610]QKY70692.1 HAD family hydrolase [Lentibacillus sp. CBA3610]